MVEFQKLSLLFPFIDSDSRFAGDFIMISIYTQQPDIIKPEF